VVVLEVVAIPRYPLRGLLALLRVDLEVIALVLPVEEASEAASGAAEVASKVVVIEVTDSVVVEEGEDPVVVSDTRVVEDSAEATGLQLPTARVCRMHRPVLEDVEEVGIKVAEEVAEGVAEEVEVEVGVATVVSKAATVGGGVATIAADPVGMEAIVVADTIVMEVEAIEEGVIGTVNETAAIEAVTEIVGDVTEATEKTETITADMDRENDLTRMAATAAVTATAGGIRSDLQDTCCYQGGDRRMVSYIFGFVLGVEQQVIPFSSCTSPITTPLLTVNVSGSRFFFSGGEDHRMHEKFSVIIFPS
jgi:hypothetical protein